MRVGSEAINLDLRRVVLAGCGALLLAGAVGTAGATAAGLPRSPAELGVGASGLKVKPRSIVYTGDGTGLLAGPNLKSKSGISWTSWTTTSAVGTGSEQVNDCVPSCAGGKYTAYPVKIEQWRPQTLGGTTVFTRMTVWFTGARPKGEQAHFTFTNLYTSKAFGWSPPSRSGYCVNTQGQKPAAGCANIATLP